MPVRITTLTHNLVNNNYNSPSSNQYSRCIYRVIRNDCRGDQILLAWPPRSPDATPCDFFLWRYVKDQVYVPPLPASIPELKVRIRTASNKNLECCSIK